MPTQSDNVQHKMHAGRKYFQLTGATAMTDRDRAAATPDERQCSRCEILFTGEAWHMMCGVCMATTASEIAATQSGMTQPRSIALHKISSSMGLTSKQVGLRLRPNARNPAAVGAPVCVWLERRGLVCRVDGLWRATSIGREMPTTNAPPAGG